MREFEEALTSEIYNAAWRYCFYLCACREDSEDLLQDSLAHGMRKFSQLRDPSGFKAWMMAVIRTRFISGLRRRKPVEELDETRIAASKQGGNQLSDTLAIALQSLPEKQKELLTLFYIEDLSLAELGTVLGLTSSMVSQRLFRARKSLRRELDSQSVILAAKAVSREL